MPPRRHRRAVQQVGGNLALSADATRWHTTTSSDRGTRGGPQDRCWRPPAARQAAADRLEFAPSVRATQKPAVLQPTSSDHPGDLGGRGMVTRVCPHEPFHGATCDTDASTVELGPHLVGAVDGLVLAIHPSDLHFEFLVTFSSP